LRGLKVREKRRRERKREKRTRGVRPFYGEVKENN
jgi:hypothetical protein